MKKRRISLLLAREGMVLSDSVHDNVGKLLLPQDFILTPRAIGLLRQNSINEICIKEASKEKAGDTKEEEQAADHGDIYEKQRVEEIRKTKDFIQFNAAHKHSVGIVKEALNNMLVTSSQINTSILLSEMDNILLTNKNNMQVFDMLHCIRNYDDSTYVHCVNVALICNVLGKWLGYSEKDIELLTLSGLLHDTGKLMMPKEIITKPSKLTKEEYEIVKTHPEVGYEILKNEPLDERIKLSALQHHEKCDGSGYPKGLKGDEICSFAKIVAIADVYDAMTANRVYREGMCPFVVIELFEREGYDKYDVNDLLVFLEHIVEAYINKRVILTDGRQAKIIMINKNRLSKPVVACEDGYFDLSADPALGIKAVL